MDMLRRAGALRAPRA